MEREWQLSLQLRAALQLEGGALPGFMVSSAASLAGQSEQKAS